MELDWLRNNLQQWQEYTKSEKIKLFEATIEEATKKAETELTIEKEQLSNKKKVLVELESSLNQKEKTIHKKDEELTKNRRKSNQI